MNEFVHKCKHTCMHARTHTYTHFCSFRGSRILKAHPLIPRLVKKPCYSSRPWFYICRALCCRKGVLLAQGHRASAQGGHRAVEGTCRRSSCSSLRASSRERSTSCSPARRSPASLPLATRASSRSASFCSLSSLASFRLKGAGGRGQRQPQVLGRVECVALHKSPCNSWNGCNWLLA